VGLKEGADAGSADLKTCQLVFRKAKLLQAQKLANFCWNYT
jgi:hypothetical protein